jgi:hypothetical protein
LHRSKSRGLSGGQPIAIAFCYDTAIAQNNETVCIETTIEQKSEVATTAIKGVDNLEIID